MIRKASFLAFVSIVVLGAIFEFASWRKWIARKDSIEQEISDSGNNAKRIPLPTLDAHGFKGIHEVTKTELLQLMSKARYLSEDDNAQLNRGCLGLTCLYQGLGITRWPESARGTLAYLNLKDALRRQCPNGQENFLFVKQGWWLARKPPVPDSTTGEVPLESITRVKPGFYTFNYAVYFPSTETYAWMDHRDYGFPINRIRPQKAFLSLSPPPLDDNRPAQIYCSTCR